VMLRLAPSPSLPPVDGSRRSFTGQGVAGLGALATIGLASLIAGCASTPSPSPVPAGGLRPAPSGLGGGHFGVLPPTLTPDGAARELVAQALLLVGSPYRWGGSRAESGFDCSGLVRYVFAESLNGVYRDRRVSSFGSVRKSIGIPCYPLISFFFPPRAARLHTWVYVSARDALSMRRVLVA